MLRCCDVEEGKVWWLRGPWFKEATIYGRIARQWIARLHQLILWLANLSFHNTIFDDVYHFIGIKYNLYVFEWSDGVVIAKAVRLVMWCLDHNVCKLIICGNVENLFFPSSMRLWEWYFVRYWPKYVNDFYGKVKSWRWQ